MDIDSFFDFLVDHVNIHDHPQFAGWPPEKQILHIGAELFTTLERHYDALASSDKADDAAVRDALRKFVSKYVEPLTKTGRPFVDTLAGVLMNQVPDRLTELLAGKIQDRMGS